MDKESIQILVLGLAGLVGVGVLIMWHRDNNSAFDLRNLLVSNDTGKVELFKIGQLFALLISSWILIHETIQNQLTEWQFNGYMLAWAGANLINKVIDAKRNVGVEGESP